MEVLRNKGWLSRNLAEPGDCIDTQYKPCGNTRYCSGTRLKIMVYHIVGEYNLESLKRLTGDILFPLVVTRMYTSKLDFRWETEQKHSNLLVVSPPLVCL